MNAIQMQLPCSPACKTSAEKNLESTVCGPQASVEAPEGLQHFHTRYVSPVSSPWLDDSFGFPTQAPADLATSVTSHTKSYAMFFSGVYDGPWLQVLVGPKYINCRISLYCIAWEILFRTTIDGLQGVHLLQGPACAVRDNYTALGKSDRQLQ